MQMAKITMAVLADMLTQFMDRPVVRAAAEFPTTVLPTLRVQSLRR